MAQDGGGSKADKVPQADRLVLRNKITKGDMMEYARKAFKLKMKLATGDSNYGFASSTVWLWHACLSACIDVPSLGGERCAFACVALVRLCMFVLA